MTGLLEAGPYCAYVLWPMYCGARFVVAVLRSPEADFCTTVGPVLWCQYICMFVPILAFRFHRISVRRRAGKAMRYTRTGAEKVEIDDPDRE